MSKEKSLPSKNDNLEDNKENILKVLPSSGPPSSSIKSLPSSDNQFVLAKSEISEIPKAVETLEKRIHNVTLTGGLNELPQNFDDRNGDWKVINSDNYFEVLYLDPKEYKRITKDVVDKNYKILKSFWDDKITFFRTGSGAIPIQLEQKYSAKVLNEAPSIIKKAYDTLVKQGGIENYINLLEEKRIENGLFKIQPLLDTVETIKILDPSTEQMIRNKGIEAELKEIEINSLIEKFLIEKKIIRGEYSSRFAEPERIFLYQIKKQLKDNLLSKEEENELKEDLEAYKISPEKFEELILQTLREVNDCEREYTITNDKKEFSNFYSNLLIKYGLDESGVLDNNAAQELFERDSSPTKFFPLKKETREDLIIEVQEKYVKELVIEELSLFTDALKKLQVKSGKEKSEKLLKEASTFKLLLPRHREEIIKRANLIINYVDELYFSEVGKSLCKLKSWKLSIDDVNELITNPSVLYSDYCPEVHFRIEINEELINSDFVVEEQTDLKKLYNISSNEKENSTKNSKNKNNVIIYPDFNFLNNDVRLKLSGELNNWANAEYDFEKKYFESTIEDLLKKYKYGLPVDKQIEQEKNNEFHLSEDERRSIITSKEKPLRPKAEKLFTELVESKIGNNTIIPSLFNYLNNENSKIYFLTTEKNDISFPVQTSQEIINSKSKPFIDVMDSLIEKLKKEKQFNPSLIKRLNLSKSASISQNDVVTELRNFYYENESQASDIFKEFKRIAEKKSFYIIEETAESEFQVFNIFNKAVEFSSKSYTLPLTEWFTDTFVDDMTKIGAAYGISAIKIRQHIDKYKQQYLVNTTPRWKEFYTYSGKFILIFLIYRLLLSISFPDWIVLDNAGSGQKIILFLDYLTCVLPFPPSFAWAAFMAILISPFAFNKSVRKLLRSYNKINIRILFVSFTLLGIISVSSLLVGNSEKFKQSYIKKFIQKAHSQVQNREYGEAVKEYDKILNLALPEEKHNYYYEKALIYERSMVTNNSISDADQALSNIESAINLNPNIAEYFLLKGSCYSFRGDLSEHLEDYQSAKVALGDANKLNPSLLKPKQAIDMVDKKITDLKRKILTKQKQNEYQQAGVFPDSKINGPDVQLKTNHSFLSSTIKTLSKNEEVKNLDSWLIKDPDIVEVISDILPTYDGISIKIPAGSLVKIIGKLDNYYIISFKTKQTELSCRIPKASIKNIAGIEWVKIKTLSGALGWVLKNDIADL